MVNGKILKIKGISHSRAIGSADLVAVDFNPRTTDIVSVDFNPRMLMING